jgi:hypothetical protein
MTLRLFSFYTIFVLKLNVIFCPTIILGQVMTQGMPLNSQVIIKPGRGIHNMFRIQYVTSRELNLTRHFNEKHESTELLTGLLISLFIKYASVLKFQLYTDLHIV